MALKESFDALSAEVVTLGGKIDVTAALVQALKDQIAAGSPVTAEQLDGVTATLRAMRRSFHSRNWTEVWLDCSAMDSPCKGESILFSLREVVKVSKARSL